MGTGVRDLLVVCGLAALLAACPRSAGGERPLATTPPDASTPSAPSAKATAPPPATAPAPAEAPPPAEARVSPTLPDTTGWRWQAARGLTFALPASASAHEIFAAKGGQYLETAVYVAGPCPGNDAWTRSACVMAIFRRVDGHGWKTLAEATDYWDRASTSASFDGTTAGANLGGGVTAAGAFYAIRSFDVRTGFSAGRGQTIHRYESVSRVYADLDAGDAGHFTCEGYLERGATKAEDPQIQALLGICTSMRRAP